jgi:hypothetical protein
VGVTSFRVGEGNNRVERSGTGILRFALNDTRTELESKNGVLAILRLVLGAGVTPAEGSVKPIAGFTFDKVPSRSAGLCRLLNGVRYGSIACSGSFEVNIHLKN